MVRWKIAACRPVAAVAGRCAGAERHARDQGAVVRRRGSGGKIGIGRARAERTRGAAQVRASKSPKAGSRLVLADVLAVEVLGRERVNFCPFAAAGRNRCRGCSSAMAACLCRPITPGRCRDEQRYQTVFARMAGAVARPRRVCVSTRPCCEPCATREYGSPMSRCMSAPEHSSRCAEYLREHAMHSECYEIHELDAIARARNAGGHDQFARAGERGVGEMQAGLVGATDRHLHHAGLPFSRGG